MMGEDKMKLSKVPGFRTNKSWKKILAIAFYMLIFIVLIAVISSMDYTNMTSKDILLQLVQSISMIIVTFGMPYIALTDVFNIRNRIKFFTNKPFLFRVVFLPICWTVGSILAMIIIIITEEAFTDEYKQTLNVKSIEEEEGVEKIENSIQQEAQDNIVAIQDEKNEFNKKEFKKQLDRLLKTNKLDEYVMLSNSNLYEDVHDIIQEQLNKYIKTAIKDKRKDIFDKDNMEVVQEIIRQFSPIHKLYNADNYMGVSALQNLEMLVSYTEAINRLEEELGDFNVEFKPIDIDTVEDLSIYVHYKIKSNNLVINAIQGFTEAMGTSNNQDTYYFTGYSERFGSITTSDNFEGIVIPKDTKFPKEGIYNMKVIRNGEMTLVNSDGFEREVPVYTEVSEAQFDRYYAYDENKGKADRIDAYKEKRELVSKELQEFID